MLFGRKLRKALIIYREIDFNFELDSLFNGLDWAENILQKLEQREGWVVAFAPSGLYWSLRIDVVPYIS